VRFAVSPVDDDPAAARPRSLPEDHFYHRRQRQRLLQVIHHTMTTDGM
jgi:hypothetical protein